MEKQKLDNRDKTSKAQYMTMNFPMPKNCVLLYCLILRFHNVPVYAIATFSVLKFSFIP